MPTPVNHEEQVRLLADAIRLDDSMRRELACLALHLGEPPDEVFAEALSELRVMRRVLCEDLACVSANCTPLA